jgi:hypothetical protein
MARLSIIQRKAPVTKQGLHSGVQCLCAAYAQGKLDFVTRSAVAESIAIIHAHYAILDRRPVLIVIEASEAP